MPGRQFVGANGYRYGFNGKENDDEVKGSGNQQDYGMRIYDPRLGKFLSADPLIVQEQLYPELSPYQFASLNPIQNIDIDGLEGADSKYENGNSQYFIGGRAMDKEEKERYNESFNNIVVPFASGIMSEFAIAGAINGTTKLYKAYKAEKSAQKIITAEKIAQKSEQGMQKAKSAFQTAKEGGKNSGLYKQYLTKPLEQIQKGIKSLAKRIDHHKNLVDDAIYRDKYLAAEKAKDPTKKLWSEMSEQQQKNQIGKWEGEVKTYSEQKEVLEGIAKEKTN